MDAGFAARLWEDRWRILAWILPAALIAVFADRAVLPMAGRLRDAHAQLAMLRENTYEAAWLDSTRDALSSEVRALREFRDSREGALNRDSSTQATVDRIRRLAQASGMEVVKTTPILAREDSLRLLKVKIEGYSHYPGLLALFRDLREGHPDLFPEEMILRQGGDRSSGRLEGQLVIHAYYRGRTGIP